MESYSKKRFAAIDAFVILLLCCAVFGVGFKVFAGNAGLFVSAEEEYSISYIIEAADSEMGKLITSGSKFYFEKDDELFGTVTGNVITTPARVYNENSKGEYVLGYSTGEQVDISGNFSVRGKMTENGFLCGGDYIAPGMEIHLRGNGASIKVLITDISKVTAAG